MALRIYKISDYDHLAETHQFEAISRLLQEKYEGSGEECILIGNYNIEGVELDALLITPGGIRILEFKNWGGRIVARENGPWTSGQMIIEGGAGKKTPYEQVRLNRSRASAGLRRMLGGMQSLQVSAAIIFGKDADIDCAQLPETVRKWLTVCDHRHLPAILNGIENPVVGVDFLRDIPGKLRIEEFSIEESGAEAPAVAYEPETASNFFEELEMAVSRRPDYVRVYNQMNQVFKRFLNLKTGDTRINFGGDFAKTDYLLKENGADGRMVAATNDTRVRLRNRYNLTADEMERCCLHDLKHLCQFIAFVCKSDVPGRLAALFPKGQLTRNARALVGDSMRVIVEQWDGTNVYVQAEEGGDGLKTVRYAKEGEDEGNDWSYLRTMFYKGAQLNLVRPREEDNVFYPELIIFEPDYLVNISTVAHCFTNYADSPYVELTKKLEPQEPTEPKVLGNLAGQLLDESIHGLDDTRTYAQSARDFFRDNAISLLTAEVSEQFHQNAQIQKRHIRQAIHETLPESVKGFNSKNGVVEPSFFSEMLGLQGRMDYLQLDFKVLMEQKSGKGAWPYDNFMTPHQTDEHYVQMLLYMTLVRYNFREIYERNGNDLQAFLLYSKYERSLLKLGFARDLIHKALRVRNGLAWMEMVLTRPEGYRILEELTPEKLNLKHADNKLWRQYQQPQLSDVLDPIHQASELEKAYFYRFLTFIANEHVLSKLGNKTKESSGFAATWHDSLEEKRQAGNIYDRLTLISPDENSRGPVSTLLLGFSETEDNDMSNFRKGDIVILYPYQDGTEPDARKTMVFRCTIDDIQTDTIRLVLRATQSDNRVFVAYKDRLWAIEHDFMESSYSSLYRGMHSFLKAPKERRDLLLLQRKPETDMWVRQKGDYGDFNELALKVKRAKDLFLIIGPPGTGKTSYGMLYTVKEELLEPDRSVLLLSYTNRAVDEICGKLKAEGIDFIRMGSPFGCADEYKDCLLQSKVEQSANLDDLRRVLLTTRVFVGTTTALNSNIPLFRLKQFSLAVIDEASQILEPHLIGLLSAQKDGKPAIRKIVMIGDHKQLPAVVQQKENVSKVQDVLLNDICLTDCRISLFERLLNKYGGDENVCYMLRKQGRMHHEIALFPNEHFYKNQLDEVPLAHQVAQLPTAGEGRSGIEDLLRTRRIAFIEAEPQKDSPSDKVNQTEADIIAAMVVKIYEIEQEKGFDVDRTVGVIVPYRNQIAAVRKTIDSYGIPCLHAITIDTVERYQGSQRKYIIYGFTIQKYHQLSFLTDNSFRDKIDGCMVDRKLNVAMTRAEEHLLMVGNSKLLCNNHTFHQLIGFVRGRQGYLSVPKDDFVSGWFEVPSPRT